MYATQTKLSSKILENPIESSQMAPSGDSDDESLDSSSSSVSSMQTYEIEQKVFKLV